MTNERERTLAWLAEHVGIKPPVLLPGEIPDDVLQTLRRLDLVLSIAGGVLVLRTPGDDPHAVLRALVWPIVETLTRMYAPAVVERDSAVRLYLGRTDPGIEIRIRQTGRTRWREEIAPGFVIRVERGEVGAGNSVQVGESDIPVDPPETVLLTLPVGFLREGLGEVALWIKSLVLSRPALVDAYRQRPRPVVLKRMEHIARDVGNDRLADLLGSVVNEEQRTRIGRDRTAIGRGLVVPPSVARMETTHQPWLDRLRASIHASREQLQAEFAALELPQGSLRRGSVSVEELLAGARSSKAYDAYHSSSIEGYRISFEEVVALLEGASGGPDTEDARSRFAIIGYGVAFDRLLERVREGQGTVRLTGKLALDLYVDLFSPSVEAGIVAADDLRGWRRSPVFIRDSLFVPPAAQKVPRMLDLLFEEVAGIEESEGLLRAALVHLWFVRIHPFPDGNGRVARFLMNTALLSGGLPWLTIQVEQRAAYFTALQRAQSDEDFTAFARFLASSLERQLE